jgi:hypothetical protein
MPHQQVERACVDRLLGVVASGQLLDVLEQGNGEWNHHGPTLLATVQAQFSLAKVKILPRQRGQIPEPLAGVEAKEHERAPFVIALCEDGFQLRERERAPGALFVPP